MNPPYQHHIIPEIGEDMLMEVTLPRPDHEYEHMDITESALRILHSPFCKACWMGIAPNELRYDIWICWN